MAWRRNGPSARAALGPPDQEAARVAAVSVSTQVAVVYWMDGRRCYASCLSEIISFAERDDWDGGESELGGVPKISSPGTTSRQHQRCVTGLSHFSIVRVPSFLFIRHWGPPRPRSACDLSKQFHVARISKSCAELASHPCTPLLLCSVPKLIARYLLNKGIDRSIRQTR